MDLLATALTALRRSAACTRRFALRPSWIGTAQHNGPTLIRTLFPPQVVVAEKRQEDWEGGLMPEEAQLIKRAVPKRVREFTAGRVCARRALGQLGITGVPILMGARARRDACVHRCLGHELTLDRWRYRTGGTARRPPQRASGEERAVRERGTGA